MLKSKLPGTGTSIFSVMSKMALEHNALNLSQGFPDFNCSDELIELVHYYQKKGMNQYAPMPGVPSLLNQVSSKIEKLYSRHYSPDKEIVITSGATEALFTAISTVINQGDEAIIFQPAYDLYAPVITANGGRSVYISLTDDFKINWSIVRENMSLRVKLIIINFPQNPSGILITQEDINQLEELSKDYSFHIISDEVYEHITFDGKPHLSLSTSEILYPRLFHISSFGKTFHTTGWKVGYCCAPENLMSEFKKLHQFTVFAVNTPVQYAYAEYLKNEAVYSELNSFYQKKRDRFLGSIKNSKFNYKPAEGTYFQLLDYSLIALDNDMEFCKYLIKEKGIAAIPLSPFYSSGYDKKVIRICFAKQDEILDKAGIILSSL